MITAKTLLVLAAMPLVAAMLLIAAVLLVAHVLGKMSKWEVTLE